MIRIICKSSDDTDMIHAGDSLDVEWKTFDVSFPEVERWLRGSQGREVRKVTGIELLPAVKEPAAR